MRAICLFAIAFVTPGIHAGVVNGNGQIGASKVNAPSLSPEENRKPVSALDQFDGVVIDQTITRAGKDFYQQFSMSWHDQPLSERYTISVKEQPSARFGSQIYIVFGSRRIFQGQMSPNRSQIKMLSDAAVEIAYKAVTEGEMQRLLFKDPDIGQDEI
jgi:curli production assembly/transport component CsgE